MEHDIKNTTGSYSTEQWIANVENKVFQLEKQIKELQEIKESKELLKFKKTHENSMTPVKANETDMCYDLFAVDDGKLSEMFIEYDTGIAFDIPEGYDVKVFPRSSISKYDLVLANGTGIIDCIPLSANILIDENGEECLMSDILSGKITEVISYDFETKKLEKQKVEKTIFAGLKEVIEIELENGNKIKITENELVHTSKGWVKGKDLILDDEVSILL